jgi:hypothetical protein
MKLKNKILIAATSLLLVGGGSSLLFVNNSATTNSTSKVVAPTKSEGGIMAVKNMSTDNHIPFNYLDISDGVLSGLVVPLQDITSYNCLLVPNTVTSIAQDAFAGSALSDNIEILSFQQNSVFREIGQDAFITSPLTYVDFSGIAAGALEPTVEAGVDTFTIGDAAFQFCGNLTSVALPSADGLVIEIGQQAFDGCAKLTALMSFTTDPDSLFKIDPTAFDNCPIDEVGGGGVLLYPNLYIGDIDDPSDYYGTWLHFDDRSTILGDTEDFEITVSIGELYSSNTVSSYMNRLTYPGFFPYIWMMPSRIKDDPMSLPGFFSIASDGTITVNPTSSEDVGVYEGLIDCVNPYGVDVGVNYTLKVIDGLGVNCDYNYLDSFVSPITAQISGFEDVSDELSIINNSGEDYVNIEQDDSDDTIFYISYDALKIDTYYDIDTTLTLTAEDITTGASKEFEIYLRPIYHVEEGPTSATLDVTYDRYGAADGKYVMYHGTSIDKTTLNNEQIFTVEDESTLNLDNLYFNNGLLY